MKFRDRELKIKFRDPKLKMNSRDRELKMNSGIVLPRQKEKHESKKFFSRNTPPHL